MPATQMMKSHSQKVTIQKLSVPMATRAERKERTIYLTYLCDTVTLGQVVQRRKHG
jgi:hypothetical protein